MVACRAGGYQVCPGVGASTPLRYDMIKSQPEPLPTAVLASIFIALVNFLFAKVDSWSRATDLISKSDHRGSHIRGRRGSNHTAAVKDKNRLVLSQQAHGPPCCTDV